MRGKNVFAKVQNVLNKPTTEPNGLNDLFLYATFVRLALRNNENIEFETEYDKKTNTLELIVPEYGIELFDQVIGIQRGPNLKRFINWLIGSQQLTTPSTDTNDPDSKFLSLSDINIWFGATYLDIEGSTLSLTLPAQQPSAINSNFKTKEGYTGNIDIYLKWIYFNGNNTEYTIKTNVTIIDEFSNSSIITNTTTISTFNLINKDIRETKIITLNNIDQNNIIDITIHRNYKNSTDPQTEIIGVIGLKLEL